MMAEGQFLINILRCLKAGTTANLGI